MESDVLDRLSLICPDKSREELEAIVGLVPSPIIGNNNDWLMEITEQIFVLPGSEPFPLYNLNDDLFAMIFSDYLNIRDKMAVGLVCHRFRNLTYWPNFKLDISWKKSHPNDPRPKDRLLPLNEYEFQPNRWRICMDTLLDRVVVREFRLDMERSENQELDKAELIDLLDRRADRFKVKSLNISFSTRKALPVFQWFLDHPAALQNNMDCLLMNNFNWFFLLVQNTQRVGFLNSIKNAFSRRGIKSVGLGHLLTVPQYTHFCNLLAPGSLLKLNVPCLSRDGRNITQLIRNLNAGAVSQLNELTLSLSQFHWAQLAMSFIRMIPAIVRKFPNLTHLHACVDGQGRYNDYGGAATNKSMALLVAFLKVKCNPQLHVALPINYDQFLRVTRRVPFTQSGDFTYIWSNGQLNLTCKVYGGQLLKQIQNLFNDPSLTIQQLAHKSHLTPCESLAFRDELNAKYGSVVLFPGPQCAKKFGHFTLTWNRNIGKEVTIAVLLCSNPSCDVCISRGD